MRKQNRPILGLDLLRAAAAYLVMLFHYTVWNWRHNPDLISRWPPMYRAMSPFTSAGWVGVDIFFVISGYIITYSIADIGPLAFVRHRVTRLLPSALICASISAAVFLCTRYQPFPVVAWLWLRSVTFWPVQPWIDGSYWTLPVEISFYFLVFLCLSTRRSFLPWLMTLVGGVSTVWNAVIHSPHQHNLIFLLVHGCFFGLGVFLYETLHYGRTWPRILALAVCLPGCIAEVFHYHVVMSDIVWVAGMIFLVGSVLLNEQALRVTGPKGAAVVRTIGLMTYPLYLVHDQVGNILIEWLHTSAGVRYGWALAITMIVMTTLAVAIVRFAEPPLKRAILLLFPRPVGPNTATALPYAGPSRSA